MTTHVTEIKQTIRTTLVFTNTPYDNDDTDDIKKINTSFSSFLRTRPMLVKFVNAFEKDRVHQRALVHLDREEFLEAGKREITEEHSHSRRNNPVAEMIHSPNNGC